MSQEFQNDHQKQNSSEINRVVEEETSAYLCDAAEGRFLKAVEDGAVILINGFLLAKMYKKFAAIALESKQGFAKGEMYTLLHPEDKEKVRSAFDEGANMIELTGDRWRHMEPFRMVNIKDLPEVSRDLLDKLKTKEDVLAFFKQTAENLPPTSIPTVQGLTREEYRKINKEGQ